MVEFIRINRPFVGRSFPLVSLFPVSTYGTDLGL